MLVCMSFYSPRYVRIVVHAGMCVLRSVLLCPGRVLSDTSLPYDCMPAAVTLARCDCVRVSVHGDDVVATLDTTRTTAAATVPGVCETTTAAYCSLDACTRAATSIACGSEHSCAGTVPAVAVTQ